MQANARERDLVSSSVSVCPVKLLQILNFVRRKPLHSTTACTTAIHPTTLKRLQDGSLSVFYD